MGEFIDLKTGNKASPKGGTTLKMRNEGIYTWNWTRLGDRRFKELEYGEHKGLLVGWTDSCTASSTKHQKLRIDTAVKKKYFTIAANRMVTSMVVCGNAVLIGGNILDAESDKGFIQAISLDEAKPIWDKTFDSKLAFGGLAVDSGNIVASFNDGTVACLGD